MSFAIAAAVNIVSCMKVYLKRVKITLFYDTEEKRKQVGS